MTRQFTATVLVSISTGGNELNLIAEIRFIYLPAIKESGPTYDCGGSPGEVESVDDVEIVSLTIDDDKKTALPMTPAWLTEWIVENVDQAELLEAVDLGPDPDEARERAIERAQEFTDRFGDED